MVKKNSKNVKIKYNKNNETKVETKSNSVFFNKTNVDRKHATVEINNKFVEFQFDTASDIILISE